MKKVSSWVVAAGLVLAMAGSVSATTYSYGGYVDGAWETPGNWLDVDNGWIQSTVLPGQSDVTMIRNASTATLTTAQAVNSLAIGNWGPAETGTLVVNGGNLLVKSLSGGTATWGDGHLSVGCDAATGVLTINSGTVTADRYLILGAGANVGTLNMNGGQLNVGFGFTGDLWDGGITFDNSPNSQINIYGGVINTTYINYWTAAGTIFFGNDLGKIIVDTDWQLGEGQIIANLLAAGKITAAAGYEIVAEAFDAGGGDWDAQIYAKIQGTQVTNPLLGYWDFEEGAAVNAGGTTTDKSGVSPAINLTLQTDAAITTDPDRSGYVLDPRASFLANQGTGGAVGALTDISKLNTPRVFTLQAWVKPRAISGSTAEGYSENWASINKDSNADTNFHNLQTMGSGILFMKKPAGYEGRLDIWRGDDWATDGTGPWHHLLVTSDGNKFYGYVDGVLRGTKDHGPMIFADLTGPWRIGTGTTHKIDDLAIWKGYCPPSSVAGLYSGAYLVSTVPMYEYQVAAPTCTGALDPDDPNLVAWYHFEEGAGSTTADLIDPANFTPITGNMLQNAAFGFDSGNKYFQPLTFGSYCVSTDPTPDNSNTSIDGSYMEAEGAKYNDANSLSDGFTVSAWINPVDSGTPQWGTIATKGGWDGIFHFYYENGGLVLQIKTEGGQGGDQRRSNSVQNIIAPGEWTHVAATWDPDDTVEEGRLYVNGFPVAIINSPTQTTGKLVDRFPALGLMVSAPGGDNNGTTFSTPGNDFQTRTFRGGIDDVRLYNRILTAEEVACLAYRACVPRLVGAFDGDCAKVDMDDFAALAAGWQAPYTILDLETLASFWLEQDVIFPVY